MQKQNSIVKFKINGINEIDMYDYISALENLAESIKEASIISGDDDIKVSIRPIKKGSIDTELVIKAVEFMGQSNLVNGALNIAAIISTVIAVRGYVSRFDKKQNEDTFIYAGKEVDVNIHNTIHSYNFRSSILSSIKTVMEIDNVESIDIIPASNPGVKINKENYKYFRNYSQEDLVEDIEESIHSAHGLYVRPVRGSYSGETSRYTFETNSRNKYYPVFIKDDDFLSQLKDGEIKLHNSDILQVDLTTIQRVNKLTGRIITEYCIDRVVDYQTRNKQHQASII